MPKLRKMLGDVQTPECLALMRLMETQSERTLAEWAIYYAKQTYLPIYAERCPENLRLAEIITGCETYLQGNIERSAVKLLLKEAVKIARETTEPIAQAAARAVSTACTALQTPTSALGFLFYGAAAVAYSQAGLTQSAQDYDKLAAAELKNALTSLKQAALADEAHPAKLKWHC